MARSTASGAGSWRGAGSTTRRSDAVAGGRVDDLAEHGGRDVEVDPAGTSGYCGADRAGDTAADVLDPVHPIGGLDERFRGCQLVELLVVAALEVDDVALAGPRDLHHRKAVRGRVGQRDEAVEEARRGHRQADARLLRQEPGSRRRMPGVALVPEADIADARRLRDAGHVGDRDADQTVDGLNVIELERFDDQVIPVG